MFDIKAHKVLAKMGYVARGVIYLTIGSLTLMSALGMQGEQTGSKGAILTIKSQPVGEFMLVLLVAGLCGYVIWRSIQGITDTDDHGHSLKGLVIRGGLIISAATHAVLAYWVVKLLFHQSDDSSGQSASSAVSNYLNEEMSTLLFGGIGVVVMLVGVAHLYKGYTSGFKKYMDLPKGEHLWLTPICQFGLMARGVVWLIIGWIVLRSAIAAGSSDQKGITDALEWLNNTPYGNWLIIIISIGLVAFGAYSFIEAIYRRVEK
ncbi:DUF1206 domain-containing protein [Aliidiomarina sp. Khilg15.8]